MLFLPEGLPLVPDPLDWTTRPVERPRGYKNFTILGKINARSNFAPLVRHDVIHFTYPDPDAVDDYGRDQFVTLHRFVVPDTGRRIGRDLAECPQFTRYRDYPPPEIEWPPSVHSYTRKLRDRCGAQVFVEEYLCDDEEFDLDFVYPAPVRTLRE